MVATLTSQTLMIQIYYVDHFCVSCIDIDILLFGIFGVFNSKRLGSPGANAVQGVVDEEGGASEEKETHRSTGNSSCDPSHLCIETSRNEMWRGQPSPRRRGPSMCENT